MRPRLFYDGGVDGSGQDALASRAKAEGCYYDALDRLACGEAIAAIEAFKAALSFDPSMLDAMHGLVRAFQDAGRYDEGISVALELRHLDPEDVLATTALSILYQHKGMIAEAEAEATRAKLLSWKHHLRAGRQ